MPWYLLIGTGFLVGLCISNAYLRHHVLTLLIWICKGLQYTMLGLIWCFEYLQDRFDDVDLPETKPTPKVKETPKQKTGFDWNNATDEQIKDYIRQHPEEVHAAKKGGE